MKTITRGLIIREQNIGEKDKLVTILTEDFGVVKGFVHGAKDIKSSKCSATCLLTYSRLTLYKRKDSYIIGDAKAIKAFVGLGKSIEKMYLAQYFCQLAQHICPREQEAKEQLSLILNGLYLLSENIRKDMLVKACVEIRLMCLSGYMPDLTMCKECGEYQADTMVFLPKTGQLVCKNCYDKSSESFRIFLNPTVTTAFRHCCYADTEKLFSFTLPDQDLDKLNFAVEEYIKFMLEKDFSTLQFLKGIMQ